MLNSIEEIKQANKAAGSHSFSPNTMRFFRSRVGFRVYPVKDGAFFTTSERYDNSTPRLYTVRRAYDDGRIETMGEFQAYNTSGEASKAARKMQDKLNAEDRD